MSKQPTIKKGTEFTGWAIFPSDPKSEEKEEEK